MSPAPGTSSQRPAQPAPESSPAQPAPESSPAQPAPESSPAQPAPESGPAETDPGWVRPTHRALVDAGITVIGHVPDGGLSRLIAGLEADDRFAVVRLTSEQEGVALVAGAWLGGGRAALLMQSSGVGNCINMLSLLATCRVPGLLLVTMRGQEGEANPWQLPMGRAAGDSMALMGVDVRRATSSDEVAAAVTRACADGFAARRATAVLIDQQVIGIKKFRGDDGAKP